MGTNFKTFGYAVAFILKIIKVIFSKNLRYKPVCSQHSGVGDGVSVLRHRIPHQGAYVNVHANQKCL